MTKQLLGHCHSTSLLQAVLSAAVFCPRRVQAKRPVGAVREPPAPIGGPAGGSGCPRTRAIAPTVAAAAGSIACTRSRLPGSDWQRGLLFSLIPWAFSLGILLPLLGGGLLGLGLGAGPLPIFGNLILHATYGVTLGTVLGLEDMTPGVPVSRADSDSWWANRGAEGSAAVGMITGLVLGGLVAWEATQLSLPPGASLAAVSGAVHPLSVVVVVALFGGTLGLLIGSFAGLASSEPHA